MTPEQIFIILPSYNEGSILRQTVESLLPLQHRIVVVDDASAESPRELLRGLPVVLLTHSQNLGQGAALQTGMDYARQAGATAVIHFDADGQHNPKEIPDFLQALENGADVALGSRFLRPEDLALVPPVKRMLLRIAKLVNLCFTGLWLTDAHNGFRALNARALEVIRLRENRMAHASEILNCIRRHKLKIAEVPTAIHYSAYALQKGQKVSNSLNIVLDLLVRLLP